MSFVQLAWKDLRREWRGREATQAGIVLVLLFWVLDLFAFQDLAGRAAAAAIWAPLVFATAAICTRGLATEADRGTLDLLRSAPVPLLWHGLARTMVNATVAAAVALLSLLAARFLFAIALSGPLLAAVLLGALCLATLGTIASGLAAQARSREVLVPVLLVPVVAPVLQAGLHATIFALGGAGWAEARSPLLLLVADLALCAGAAVLLWPFILEGD